MGKGMLIVISGFSGVGKGTVIKQVLDSLPSLYFSVSCTTRAPRFGEENGVNYYFITEEEFERRIARDEFAEHTRTFTNCYGTLKSEIDKPLSHGLDVLLELNVVGADSIKKLYPDCVSIFIAPPSMGALRARLEGRGTETPEEIARRLKEIALESGEIEKYDYIVTNSIARTCADEVVNIIRCEHMKVARNDLKNKFSLEE